MPDRIDPAAQHAPSSPDLEPALTGCPSWCDDRSDVHRDYDEATSGGLMRTHSHDVGSVEGASPSAKRDSERTASASVDLVAAETVHIGEAGVDVAQDQPRVAIWAEYVLLDEPATRRLAALLVAAADQLDAITSR